VESLLKMIRAILGTEHVEAAHDDARQTRETKKPDDVRIPAPAPTHPAFTDSARNPNVPDTARWQELNRPDFTRHSFRIIRAGRGRDGGVVLFEVDVRTGERIQENETTSFALEKPRK